MPTCDGARGCPDNVTHIGAKGYVYCTIHAQWRRDTGAESTRRMRGWELERLRMGRPLLSYKPIPKPRVQREDASAFIADVTNKSKETNE